MRIHLFLIFLLLNIHSLSAQTDLKKMEERIFSFYDRSLKDSVGLVIKECNDSVVSLLKSALTNPLSYTYPFSSLPKIGIISSPDNAFRMFNWNYYDREGICRYCMLIQCDPGKADHCNVIAFQQTGSLRINQSEFIKFNFKEWYGALYYSIIPQKLNSISYYILLGFLPKDDLTNQKVIELMYFDEEGCPVLGMPLISILGKTYCRYIFEFNERVSMTLHYDEKTSMIVFDHLAPNGPQNEGNFSCYGPDGTYDGLLYDEKFWHIVSKVVGKNTKQIHTHTVIRSNPVKKAAEKK
jgi:hypothetical protein